MTGLSYLSPIGWHAIRRKYGYEVSPFPTALRTPWIPTTATRWTPATGTIAAIAPIRRDKDGFRSLSQSGTGSYSVVVDEEMFCECPDFQDRWKMCKHIYAVQVVLQREEGEEVTTIKAIESVEVTHTQSWSSYNAVQVREGELFGPLLREPCDSVPQPPQTRGRPRLPLSDMLYGLGLKVYSTLSSRRAMSEIRNAVACGMMAREPNFSTPMRYLEKPDLTPVLRTLIQGSSLPLRDVEVDFAQDASGFASTSYNRWFDHKWGNSKKETKWVKLHLMCGVQTNMVTAADATASMSADSPYLPDFVRTTAQHFNIREVSADKAYSSRRNLQAIDEVGGVPYIPFTTNAVGKPKEKRHRDALWEKMYHEFTLRLDDFNRHYHKRSNAETTFYMIKAKFGETIRAKTDTAQVNEALLKVLCHNICVVIKAMHQLGTAPDFQSFFSTKEALAEKRPAD